MKFIEYTRSERNAIVVLLLILLLLLVLKQPIVLRLFSNRTNTKEDSTRYLSLINEIQQAEDDNEYSYTGNTYEKKYVNNDKYNYQDKNFIIDINKANAEEFEKLYGIGKVYSERIVKYRNKIGGFESIEQLKEVYGIHDTVYQKFKHQLVLSNPNKQINNQNQQKKEIKIELNSATHDELVQLNGIGNVYAKRIVEFRDKLGGFYNIEQVKDVYGIHDTVFQKIKPNIYLKPATILKLNINNATLEELTANPYFFTTLAKQIIGYRTKVKSFSNIEDLKKLYYIRDNPEYYEKILPYVRLE
ncbi:MAG: helix-hairpin-helix domain-containing protein [Sphingobacteriales bacterium]|nr:MAG: helix-hairpin-helix domain-containing protein [Sphingobacteriales bacterium]